jgi:hypothetical protein
MKKKKHYNHIVYGLIDPRDMSVFYVGKGKSICSSHQLIQQSHNAAVQQRMTAIRLESQEPLVRTLGRFETEEQAFLAEALFVRSGLIKNLCNDVDKVRYPNNIRSFSTLKEILDLDEQMLDSYEIGNRRYSAEEVLRLNSACFRRVDTATAYSALDKLAKREFKRLTIFPLLNRRTLSMSVQYDSVVTVCERHEDIGNDVHFFMEKRVQEILSKLDYPQALYVLNQLFTYKTRNSLAIEDFLCSSNIVVPDSTLVLLGNVIKPKGHKRLSNVLVRVAISLLNRVDPKITKMTIVVPTLHIARKLKSKFANSRILKYEGFDGIEIASRLSDDQLKPVANLSKENDQPPQAREDTLDYDDWF